MKVLLLCHKLPYPPKDGGSIATLNFAIALTKLGHKVTILGMNTYKRSYDVKKIPDDLKKDVEFYSAEVDTKIKPLPFVLNLFSSENYHIWRYGSSEKFKEKLRYLLLKGNYDVVQFESLFVAPYLADVRNLSDAFCVLRAHNIESEIFNRLSRSENFLPIKLWLKMQAERLKKYEFSMVNHFDAIVPITKRDAEIFQGGGCSISIHVMPFGIFVEKVQAYDAIEEDFPSLFFIGALDWTPNQQGLEWFFKNVWVDIVKKFPNLKFYIAGRNPHLWRFTKKINFFPNVVLVGEVDDAYRFIKTKSIMIVPLLAGSGMRVKIIEAMSLGKTVISTSVGAEGIECENGKEILIADTPSEFISHIAKCVEDKLYCESIGSRARKIAFEKYDLMKIAQNYVDFIASLLKRKVYSQ